MRDVKILKNTATGRSRVLMRRDQILKICCNHFITPNMTLQTTAGNAKSWTWQTPTEASSSSSLTCKSLREMLAPAGAGSVGLGKQEKEGDEQIMTGAAEGAGAGEQVEPNDRDGNV